MKFRRQHPVGSYVLDFYCALAKLAVEVEGIAVLRVSAEAVRVNLNEVLERIQREAEARVRG